MHCIIDLLRSSLFNIKGHVPIAACGWPCTLRNALLHGKQKLILGHAGFLSSIVKFLLCIVKCINAAAVMFTHSDGPVIKIKSRKWSNNKSTQMNRPNNDAWQRGGGRGHWQHYKIENVSEFDWTVDSFAPTSWFWSQTLKITLYYVRIDECCHDESLVVGWGGWKGWRAQSARD